MSEALDKTSGPRHRKGGAPVWRGDGAGRSQVRYRLSGPPVSSLSSGSGAGISRSSSAEGGSAAHGAPHGGSERAESGRWRRDTPPALPSDHCTSRRSLHEPPVTAARAPSVPAGPQARVCGVLVRVWPAACGCVGVCVCVCMCVSVYVRRTPVPSWPEPPALARIEPNRPLRRRRCAMPRHGRAARLTGGVACSDRGSWPSHWPLLVQVAHTRAQRAAGAPAESRSAGLPPLHVPAYQRLAASRRGGGPWRRRRHCLSLPPPLAAHLTPPTSAHVSFRSLRPAVSQRRK